MRRPAAIPRTPAAIAFMRYALRPAKEVDYEFLYRLFVATMRSSITELWGVWDEARWAAFLQEHFDASRYQVVVVEGRDVGALAIERRPGQIHLDTVEIAPEYQGRGLGSALIRTVLEEAWKKGASVTLQVNRANRSRRLYERLGFTETGQTPTHYHMRASPPVPLACRR